MRLTSRIFLVTTFILAKGAYASTVSHKAEGAFGLVELTRGHGVIWGMAFLDAHRLLFTERQGQVQVLDLRTGKSVKLKGVPAVWGEGQGGLLDVQTHPDYPKQDWIYFTYAKPVRGQGATTLARAKLKDEQLVQWQDLLVTQSRTKANHHFGSRIAFDGKGHVFFGVGDRGHRPNGQDLLTHAGSILRLNLDGSVPEDNPMVDKKGKALPEIWSYGHRNPQGLFYDPSTQTLWETEHGPRGGDEVNRIEKGKNYGWATISFGKEYWGPQQVGEGTHKEGVEPPVKQYTPSIAPSGLIVYGGAMFPQWRGSLLLGALAFTHLNRLAIKDGVPSAEERLLEDLGERIRSVIEAGDGSIVLSTDSGRILRLLRPIKGRD